MLFSNIVIRSDQISRSVLSDSDLHFWLRTTAKSAGQSHRNEYQKYKFPWPPSGESGLENLEGASDEYLHKSNMGFQFSPLTENHREGKSLKGDLPNS